MDGEETFYSRLRVSQPPERLFGLSRESVKHQPK